MIGRLRVYVSTIKKIACYYHKIYAATERVLLDDFSPRAKEVGGSVRQIVPLDTEMNVSYVKKPGHRGFYYRKKIITVGHKIW
jgi:hypothetical protein